MAGILDAYQFDPATYSGSVAPPGWLGLMLGAPVNQPTRYSPTPDPFPGIDLPQSSQPDAGTLPAPQPAPQAPSGGGIGSLFAGLGNLFGPSQANAQPLTPQGPGMMDRLSAGAANFTTGGNPIAGILNAISGLTTGARTDPAGIQQAQIMSTYRALVGAGVPPAVAQAAALNPEVMKTIAPQLYSKPTLVETGTDPLTGQKSYAWQQPDQMKISPAISNGAPVGPGPASAPGMPGGAGQMQQIADAVRSGTAGDEFLSQLPPAFGQQVKMIADGRAPYPSGFMLKTPYGQMLTQAVSAYKPGMTAQDFSARLKMREDLAKSGNSSIGGILANGESAFKHLAELGDSFAGLGNYAGPNIPGGAYIGNAGNFIANDIFPTPQTKGKMTAITDNATHYGQEATKFYSATGGGEAERMQALKEVGGGATNAESQAAYLEKEKSLMLDRMETKLSQIRDVLGDEEASKIIAQKMPTLQKNIAKIDANIAKLRGEAPPASAPAADHGTPAPLPKPDAQGWITLPNGIRIREKK